MHFIIRFIITALAVIAISYWPWHMPGIAADSITAALLAALVLGIANAIIRPILMALTCPLIILTLGIGTLFINALIFYFGLKWIPGFHVAGYWAAFWGALVVSLISWFLSLIIREPQEERRQQQGS
jgi:putative membrane protein